ncbi:MarR family winged helix-turn-helix transcriptional regulator [Microbacterium azadirachtae]|uniref:Organic hydroperoxide resistance transcriptional regulator n=1 Tax=Microbacterium azadirachtae TaxID=582680 RepID=A0A0F0LVZ5_9MICO|nr:MarR family winged helix-turn-helix transcriptional regulator [Microbacterium azadirachtae]KJL36475.1 Organic hydroperoxide resistance transcriptional regulator [Microbacterium azadirachtae]
MAATDEMVCFALYAATRATTQAYRALLEPWGLTYPQYLVLVTLWLDGDQTVSSLGDRLQLDSGTLSPLLRRMESSDLIVRERRSSDERVVSIGLTPHSRRLREELREIPRQIAEGFALPDRTSAEDLIRTLHAISSSMHEVAAAGAPQPSPVRTSAPRSEGDRS